MFTKCRPISLFSQSAAIQDRLLDKGIERFTNILTQCRAVCLEKQRHLCVYDCRCCGWWTTCRWNLHWSYENIWCQTSFKPDQYQRVGFRLDEKKSNQQDSICQHQSIPIQNSWLWCTPGVSVGTIIVSFVHRWHVYSFSVMKCCVVCRWCNEIFTTSFRL